MFGSIQWDEACFSKMESRLSFWGKDKLMCFHLNNLLDT